AQEALRRAGVCNDYATIGARGFPYVARSRAEAQRQALRPAVAIAARTDTDWLRDRAMPTTGNPHDTLNSLATWGHHIGSLERLLEHSSACRGGAGRQGSRERRSGDRRSCAARNRTLP